MSLEICRIFASTAQQKINETMKRRENVYNREIEKKRYMDHLRVSPSNNNQQTVGHRTLIFGFEGENQEYEYRVYSSGCYYLNKENESFSNSLFHFESLFALLFLLINVMKSLNNWSMFSFSSFFLTNSF